MARISNEHALKMVYTAPTTQCCHIKQNYDSYTKMGDYHEYNTRFNYKPEAAKYRTTKFENQPNYKGL